MRIKQAERIIVEAIKKTINRPKGQLPICPFAVGTMGIGKTHTFKLMAKKLKLWLVTINLASYEPSDIGGMQMPDGDSMKTLRPKWLLSEAERQAKIDEGYNGVMYYFDELVQAPILNMNIFATVADEYRIGDYHIPLGDIVVCAGNRMSDRSGVNQMPMHLKDRITSFAIEPNLDDWTNYMSANKKDHRVVSWVRFQPEFLHKFDRDADAFPTPRSLERTSDILQWDLDEDDLYTAVCCQIGETASASLFTHIRLHEKCPDIDELIKNPEGIQLPTEVAIQFATVSSLVSKVTDKNIGAMLKFLNRLDGEFLAYFIKDSVAKDRELLQNKELRLEMSTNQKLRELVL